MPVYVYIWRVLLVYTGKKPPSADKAFTIQHNGAQVLIAASGHYYSNTNNNSAANPNTFLTLR